MTLGEIKQKLAPIEALAHPKQNEYLRNIKKWKMAILYRLSKKVPLNGIVVEIGTRYGSTAILMALTAITQLGTRYPQISMVHIATQVPGKM